MQYYINLERGDKNTAGTKAPRDISEICRRKGMREITMQQRPLDKNNIYTKVWLARTCISFWNKLSDMVQPGDVVLFQHPMYGNRLSAKYIPKIQEEKQCKFIALIHDLESLRRGIEGVVKQRQKTSEISDDVLLKKFDAMICHNEHMRQYLLSQGFAAERLVNLELFDYLCDWTGRASQKGERPSIAIAGNLAIGKSAYIYDILDCGRNEGLTLHLYGNNFEQSRAGEFMRYHGSFLPEELPKHLVGDFGLVWDGISAETCAGNTGEYLRYNNPHKTSLYLASGMPVIVWSQSAVADFVLDNEVGIAVDSLYELNKIILDISETEYLVMCRNAEKIGAKIRTGGYFSSALEKCLDILKAD